LFLGEDKHNIEFFNQLEYSKLRKAVEKPQEFFLCLVIKLFHHETVKKNCFSQCKTLLGLGEGLRE